jgi:hypothetical protein
MSEKPTPEETTLWQRRLAVQANNRAWTLSELTTRTDEEDEEMLQAASAAIYFWKIVGNEKNKAHAAQLLAHVYALLGLGNPAAYYLDKSEPVFFGGAVEPWELALAHAVTANVAASRKDAELHRTHHEQATSQIASLEDPEDRSILEATLRVIPAPQPRPSDA